MKRFLFGAAMSVACVAAFAADVGVSVSVGEPGFYGRIDIGNVPQPRLIYSAPVMIERVPVAVAPQPIYLHVPPGHAKHWRRHCHEYRACGQPVYFVQDGWYNDVYVPHYREHRRDYRDGRRDFRDDRRDDRHGRGRGRDRDHMDHRRGHGD